MVENRRGVTLMEMLIVVAIVGVLAVIGPPMFTQTTKFFILSKTKLALQRESRAIMYVVTRELNQAQNATIVIDQIPGQPYYSRIRFTKAQGTAVTIAQNGANLLLTEGNTTTTLTSDVDYLSFTFPHTDDMTILSVSMTLQEQIYGAAVKALHMASEQVMVMD